MVLSHRFAVNQNVFCFEPDPSKAKLIYSARIIQQCPISFLNDGRFYYYVHFQGWKRKWDREVAEDLLLEDNMFNRMLKRKIDEVASKVCDKERRRQRIDLILFGASMSGDDVDWNNLPGVWKLEDCNSNHVLTKRKAVYQSKFSDNLFFGEFDETDEMDIERFNCENMDIHYTFMPKIILSPSLSTILEQHVICSLKENEDPENYNVFEFLQSYLDEFPYKDITLPSWGHFNNHIDLIRKTYTEKSARSFFQSYQQTDTNKVICAEFISGLRVIFDNILFDYLLTQQELKNTDKLRIRRVKNSDSKSTSKKFSRFNLLSHAEANENPDLPCLNFGIRFLLRLIVRLPNLIHRMNLTKQRKAIVYRHMKLFIQYIDATQTFWFRKYLLHNSLFSPAIDNTASSQTTEPQDKNELEDSNSIASTLSTIPGQADSKKSTRKVRSSISLTSKMIEHSKAKSISPPASLRNQYSIDVKHRVKRTSPSTNSVFSINKKFAKFPRAAICENEIAITKLTKNRVSSNSPIKSSIDVGKKLPSPAKPNPRSSLSKEIANLLTTLKNTTPSKKRRLRLITSIGSRRCLEKYIRFLKFSNLSSLPENLRPPEKVENDSLAVLKALASTVRPNCPDESDYRLIDDPWLLDLNRTSHAFFLKAKATGRRAARLAIDQYFPQDIITLATEIPKINAFMPIYRPADVISLMENGELELSSGLKTCVDLLATKEAWTIFEKNSNYNWDNNLLHELLDLFARTNGGVGGSDYFFGFPIGSYTSIPFPEEVFYSEEIQLKSSFKKTSTKKLVADSNWVNDDTNLAERLFTARYKDLSTYRGFSSMIRGAARFGNIERAIELFNKSLDLHKQPPPLCLYHELFRSLKNTEDSEKLFKLLFYLLKKMVTTSKLNPSSETFEAISHGLARFCSSSRCNIAKDGPILISYFLGLSKSMKSNHNLKPTLGFLANFFYAINKTHSSGNIYDTRRFLASTVKRIDDMWKNEASRPSYIDKFSEDDRTFFSNAMKLARAHGDIETGDLLTKLVWRDEDRRYFLKDSLTCIEFYHDYCSIVLSTSNIGVLKSFFVRNSDNNILNIPNLILEKIWKVFLDHRDICHSSKALSVALLSRLTNLALKTHMYCDKDLVYEMENERPVEWKQLRLNLHLDVLEKVSYHLSQSLERYYSFYPLFEQCKESLKTLIQLHFLFSYELMDQSSLLNTNQQLKLLQCCRINLETAEFYYESLKKLQTQTGALGKSENEDFANFATFLKPYLNQPNFNCLILLSLAPKKFETIFPTIAGDSLAQSTKPPLHIRLAELACHNNLLDWFPLMEMILTAWAGHNSVSEDFWRIIKLAPLIKHPLSQDRSLQTVAFPIEELRKQLNSVISLATESLKMESSEENFESANNELNLRLVALEYIKRNLNETEIDVSNNLSKN